MDTKKMDVVFSIMKVYLINATVFEFENVVGTDIKDGGTCLVVVEQSGRFTRLSTQFITATEYQPKVEESDGPEGVKKSPFVVHDGGKS